MKPTHVRNYSASSQKRQVYSSVQSPTSSIFTKKTNSDPFQAQDLRLSLNLGPNTKTPKVQDTKPMGASVFINNFSVQIKPSGMSSKSSLMTGKHPATIKQVEKKNPMIGGKGDRLSDETYKIRAEHERRMELNGGYEPIDFISPSPSSKLQTPINSRPKGTPSMGTKPSSKTSLQNAEFVNKYKGGPDSKKFAPSPRNGSLAMESSIKQQGHVKNKRSFDLSNLYQNKKPYSDNYGKPSFGTNSSTNDSDNYHSRPRPQHIDNHSNHNFIGSPHSKPSTPSKSGLTTSVRVDGQISAPKHKRTPSYDLHQKNDSNHMKQSAIEYDRAGNRRASDASTNMRLSGTNFHAETPKTKKPTLKFAIRTRAGNTVTGARKTNQDSYIACSNFGRSSSRYLFGVCDGHGSNGHHVSGFVKETLPVYLLADPQIESRPEVTFTNAFELCHQKLLLCDFDSKFSGTTCVTLLISGNRIISANAGDSRAVMAGYNNRQWDFTPLSNDHKPNLLVEAQRILMSGGRIEAFKDHDGNFVGPSRVWLLNQDIPGLAMSRSIGDVVASTVGVTCRPEIREFEISPNDKFIVVASDGVWEFIENEEVVKVVAPFYEAGNLDGACDFLMALAIKRWQEEEENVVDDITLIVIFLS